MSVQLNIILLSAGALQGAFLFALLYKKRKSLPGYAFLAGYLLVMILQITMKVVSKLWLWETIRPIYSFSYNLPFLYGPLIWLFVKRFTTREKTGKNDIIHLLLSAALGAFFVYNDLSNQTSFLVLDFFNIKRVMTLQIISLFTYHFLAFRILKKYWDSFSEQFIQFYGYRIAWLRQFVVTSFFVCTIISVVICLMYLHFPNWQNIRLGFIALTVFIYWISYKSWNQAELFTGLSGSHAAPGVALTISLPQKKYANSSLGNDDMEQIITSLDHKLRNEKYYLDPELTIDHLAASISCSRHHLSQSMNEKLGRSFYDHINYFRVEEAKLLLTDSSKTKFKIATLAYDAGFNSLSTFNDVFKRFTGLTPSQFREQQKGNVLRKTTA